MHFVHFMYNGSMSEKANIARLWEQDLTPEVRERFDAVREVLEEDADARRVQQMRERQRTREAPERAE